MSGEKLQDLYKIDVVYTKLTNFRIEWNGSTVSLLTDRGIETLELTCNIESYSKIIDFTSYFLPCPRSSPVSDLIPRSATSTNAFRSSSQGAFVDPALWAHNVTVEEGMSVITNFEWCPPDVGFSCRNILAIITSHGAVSFYTRRKSSWHMLLDLSRHMILCYNWNETDNIDLVRQRCTEIQCSSICWISTPTGCWFATANRTQKVVLWKLAYCDETDELRAEMKNEVYPGIGEIKCMTYIPKKDGTFIFLCTAFNGTIKLFNGLFEGKGYDIVIDSFHDVWPFRDMMVVNKVTWCMNGENVLILCAKNRNLEMFLVSTDNSVIAHYTRNVDDYTVTGLTEPRDKTFYVSTYANIFKVNFTINYIPECAIGAEFIKVDFKEDYADCSFYDISPSKNSAIWAISAMRNPLNLRSKNTVSVIFQKMQDYKSIDVLLKNPSEKMTEMWDCVEVLRLQVTKEKRLPDANLFKIFSDPNLSTYHMKLYLILWRLNKNTVCFFKSDSYIKYVFGSLTPETVKDTLLIRHAIYLIDELFLMHQKNVPLKDFEKDTFVACCRFCEYYCKKYKCDISSYGNSEAFDFAKTLTVVSSYKCAYCDGDLVEYKCASGHLSQFCIISLQPILTHTYLECRICGGTAHPSLYLQNPMCTFCDVLMIKSV